MAYDPRVFPDYATALIDGYQEEIGGIAFFRYLAEAHGGRARESLTLMEKIEAATLATLHPLILRHDLAVEDTATMFEKGARDAEEFAGMTWDEILDWIIDVFPGYIVELEGTVALAPAGDRERVAALVDHDVAMLDFARMEKAGDQGGLELLRGYLETVLAGQARVAEVSTTQNVQGPN
jgi:hypothetical protein